MPSASCAPPGSLIDDVRCAIGSLIIHVAPPRLVVAGAGTNRRRYRSPPVGRLGGLYGVRPTPDARVSCPLEWDEVPHVELGDFTIATVPARFAEQGDPHAVIEDTHHSLEPLLDLVARQERAGQGDAPWPPQFPKAEGEPLRVQPSRKKKT